MNNLDLYNKVRTVPNEAKKSIGGGRLKGMTDINPMWRIKTLTEHFGPCGIGWYYDITEKRIEEGANGERVAFVDIALYINQDEGWTKPIRGTGGSSFIAAEKNGLYTSDECFKMALTDAISVSCKALGIGADVYYEKDRSKYDVPVNEIPTKKTIEVPKEIPLEGPKTNTVEGLKCSDCGIEITKKIYDYSFQKKGKALCYSCQKK